MPQQAFCSNCLYYDTESRCRANPPSDVDAGTAPWASWPLVRSTDWCGGWRDSTSNWTLIPEDPRAATEGRLADALESRTLSVTIV